LIYHIPVTNPPPDPVPFFHLLADEGRWNLLLELARGDRKVSELTALTGRPQNLVSYHLALLRDAGLVSSRRSSADRRDTYYRIDMHRWAGALAGVGAAIHPALSISLAALDARAPRRSSRVLFLCTGNSARSQMAEALLEHRSGGAITARSAGSHPKPLHPNAVRVMAERGIDISARKSKHLDRFTGHRFDRVITLCDKLREICPEFPGAAGIIHWSMPDPSAGDADYQAFVRTAEDLQSRIPYLIGELTANNERRPPQWTPPALSASATSSTT
jgi:protein-tyrosine-phosphatase/DNA-binding transcriptional ArsR family regulator